MIWLWQDFILRALCAGGSIALLAGPLGALLVWRRLAYFGDALAHAALLGASCAMLWQINVYFGLFGICLLVAVVLVKFSKQRHLANDTILAIVSHSALALGLIIAAISGKINVLDLLFGDILTVTDQDLYLIVGLALVILAITLKSWRAFLLITLQRELAYVSGVNVAFFDWLFMLLMALLFAIAMKLVGVLLITALLIIPAASARSISKTPEQMALFASILGVVAVFLGVTASLLWDIPTGPAIVVAAAAEFITIKLLQLYIQPS
ncbi:MAG: hypothetical protein COC15_04295 [Legionellales bacterium]|nr:MAG: hypothetical protein COC15_04295 [Legionellales bacterium]